MAGKRRSPRSYAGRPPDGEIWFKYPATLYHEEDGTTWRLYTSDGDWPRLKLCVVGKAEHKANYWLIWAKCYSRFVRSREAGKLYENRPKLYADLEALLQRKYLGL